MINRLDYAPLVVVVVGGNFYNEDILIPNLLCFVSGFTILNSVHCLTVKLKYISPFRE